MPSEPAGSLSQIVPERIGFFNDGACEWCKVALGTMIVNLPGNALKTRVCGPCLYKAREEGGGWQEICYNCMGTGDLGDDFSPCPDCDGSGYDEDGSQGWDEDDLIGEAGREAYEDEDADREAHDDANEGE